MSRMLSLVFLLIATLSTGAIAGPNQGGTLILHTVGHVYSNQPGYNPCGRSELAGCNEADTTWEVIAPNRGLVLYVMAAFPNGASPRLASTAFRIESSPVDGAWVDWWSECDGDIAVTSDNL